MNETDISVLRKAVENYRFYRPAHSADPNAPCSVGELNALLENTALIFDKIIDRLEH